MPTPTGRLVLEYLDGRVPGFVDTTLNVAHVEDVAEGHVLALERGDIGRSYILGGENYSLQHLLEVLAACTGLPEARLRVPRSLSLGVAHVSEFVEGRLMRRHPTVPIEAARMSTTKMAFDDSRARKELGYAPRPAEQAVFDSARWFVENGYVKVSRRARIRWRRPSRSGLDNGAQHGGTGVLDAACGGEQRHPPRRASLARRSTTAAGA